MNRCVKLLIIALAVIMMLHSCGNSAEVRAIYKYDEVDLCMFPFAKGDTLFMPIPAFCNLKNIEFKKGTIDDVVIKRTDCASVFINTESGTLDAVHADKNVKEKGEVVIINREGRIEYNGDLEYIKGRGNSTWENFAKKPYSIKLMHSTRLIGMRKSSKYNLLANAFDESSLRNKIALDLCKAIGDSYTVDSQYVQLWINGEYRGLYLLTTKVDVKKRSVDIADLEDETQMCNKVKLKKYKSTYTNRVSSKDLYRFVPSSCIDSIKAYEIPNEPEDITGGYLLNHSSHLNSWDNSCSGFISEYNVPVMIESPKYASLNQVRYIRNLYNSLQRAVASPNGIDSVTHKHYSYLIDVEAFARYYVVEELLLNGDGGWGSFYIVKDKDTRDKLLKPGPHWDFDWSMARITKNRVNVSIPDVLYLSNGLMNNPSGFRGLIGELCHHSDFMEQAKKMYWKDIRDSICEYCTGKYYKELVELMINDVAINNLRWPQAVTQSQHASNQRIKEFMTKRISFFDDIWGGEYEKCHVLLDVNWRGDEHDYVHVYYPICFVVKKGECLHLPDVSKYSFHESDSKWKFVDVVQKSSGKTYNPEYPIMRDDTLQILWKRVY